MASRTVELKLRVRYERNDGKVPTMEECRDALLFWMENAMQTELLVGDSDHLMLEDHRYEIQTVDID